MVAIERVSIEVTNRCDKACWFCYNHSHAEADTQWDPDELVEFVRDCSMNGVKAVSFGGGEPLQYEGLFEVINRLHGCIFRSMTTNGTRMPAAMAPPFEDEPLPPELDASEPGSSSVCEDPSSVQAEPSHTHDAVHSPSPRQ